MRWYTAGSVLDFEAERDHVDWRNGTSIVCDIVPPAWVAVYQPEMKSAPSI